MHLDAEVHFWKYEKSLVNPLITQNKLLHQNYLPEQLSQSLQRNGLSGCIAAAAEPSEVETRFLCELAQTHPEILGVIGWCDVQDAQAPQTLEKLQEYRALKGYRISVTDSLPPAAVIALFLANRYTIDLQLTGGVPLNEFIQRHPEIPFVLTDSGSPDTTHPPTPAWEKSIRTLAENQHLSCKVSGLITHGNRKSWKPADFYPFLDILFDAFGTERLMFASDWPFLLLAGIYIQWKSLLEKFTENFIEEDRDKFFGDNARRIYNL